MKIHLPTSFSKTRLPKVGNRRKPSRDWLMLLSISFLLLVASIGWNIWTFLRITSGETVDGAAPVVTNPDVTALEKVRGVFASRALEEQRYVNEYRFVDPSK